jgi:hypothetical protein
VARRGRADGAEHRGVQSIDVISRERVDGDVANGWDDVMLRVHVVCTAGLRAPCASPQGQPLGEPIADSGGESTLPVRSGCLPVAACLGEGAAVHAVLSAAEAEAELPAVAPLESATGTASPSSTGCCHVAPAWSLYARLRCPGGYSFSHVSKDARRKYLGSATNIAAVTSSNPRFPSTPDPLTTGRRTSHQRSRTCIRAAEAKHGQRGGRRTIQSGSDGRHSEDEWH